MTGRVCSRSGTRVSTEALRKGDAGVAGTAKRTTLEPQGEERWETAWRSGLRIERGEAD